MMKILKVKECTGKMPKKRPLKVKNSMIKSKKQKV